MYWFGHGLSYTTFEYSDLRLTPRTIGVTGKTTVGINVANTGRRADHEVVQMYVHDRAASLARPTRKLKGFKRITLGPGEMQTVSLTLSADQMTFYNRDMKRVVEPGLFDVIVRTNAAAVKMARLEVR